MRLRHLAGALLPVSWNDGITARLRRDYHADDVLLCGSGTQALQVALEEAARRTGSRTVALPGFGCYDLASAAIGADVRVCLYDLDPSTLAPDPDSLREAVRAGARTVVAAPLFGMPLPWDEISELARTERCLLIEDAAQGHGAAWHDRPLGAWGPLSIISFGRGKGWTAGGGGALFARDGQSLPADLPSAPVLTGTRSAVSSLAQWALGRPRVYGIPAGIPALGLGQTIYHEPRAPYALGRYGRSLLAATRAAAAAEAVRRRENAAILAEAVLHYGLETYAPPAGSVAGYLRFPLLLPPRARALADSAAARHLGIAAAYPAPLSVLPALSPRVITRTADCPGAVTLVRRLITLPTHSLLTPDDLHRLVAFIAAAAAAAAGKQM